MERPAVSMGAGMAGEMTAWSLSVRFRYRTRILPLCSEVDRHWARPGQVRHVAGVETRSGVRGGSAGGAGGVEVRRGLSPAGSRVGSGGVWVGLFRLARTGLWAVSHRVRSAVFTSVNWDNSSRPMTSVAAARMSPSSRSMSSSCFATVARRRASSPTCCAAAARCAQRAVSASSTRRRISSDVAMGIPFG